MRVKIRFKRLEILAILFIILVCLFMYYILLYSVFTNNLISPDLWLITICVIAGLAALIYVLWIFMSRLIKSFTNVYALEIDDFGITNNISKQVFLGWDEIEYFSTSTVQMTSGRHSKILVHTYNPSQLMKINTDLILFDKNELLDILEQKLTNNLLVKNRK